ncbi:ABC transporter ATP-binding protein [Microvirga brassicacearum]|uniref:ABC transporter ATP-binding protein n=1 Tax=Microvirga brassicacearum TaxID=2580413 RepID=A0A5N3PJ71_9HYPH|nr:ABC transporter ATP-binding protein [Microvirga brassicacearum]KAB0269778.1 ABC transporter ATP-binding protein [Microvirga brassicacearum]
MSKIVIESLVKRFGSFTALNGIDLAIEPGEFIGLLGPSGCGKTTTLNIVAGFEDATSGRVVLDGRDLAGIPANRREMGVVFQSYALFPHMTISENVAFGLEMRKLPRADRESRAKHALSLVRLEHLADRYPRQLSGGQQQRVAVARALAIEPSLLLLDEPLSNLDAKLREEMQVELRAIQRRVGTTTIMVTHDQAEALATCDRIAVMDAGRIVQFADPLTLYDNPRTQFAASFVGKSSQLPGRVVSVAGSSLSVQIDGCSSPVAAHARAAVAIGDAVVLALRPEKIQLAAPGEGFLNGTLVSRVFQGSSWLFVIDTPAGTVLVCDLHRGEPAFAEMQPLSLSWRPEDVALIRDGTDNG